MSSVVPASYRPVATCPAKARESAPAQKARPTPVTIMARTSGLPAAAASNQRYSVGMRPVQAFMGCGRLKVIVAIASATPYCVTFSSMAGGFYPLSVGAARDGVHVRGGEAALLRKKALRERAMALSA